MKIENIRIWHIFMAVYDAPSTWMKFETFFSDSIMTKVKPLVAHYQMNAQKNIDNTYQASNDN